MIQAMECVPVPTEHPDGTISYDFQVESSNSRMNSIEEFNNTEHYFENEQGELIHKLDGFDFEQAQYSEDDYIPELTQEDFESFLTPSGS